MNAATQLEAVAAPEHGRIPRIDIGAYLAGERRRSRALSPALLLTGECRTTWPPKGGIADIVLANLERQLVGREPEARYSNDRFRATPNRVINQNDASRYAIPFFLGPNHDSVVKCVPTCGGPDNPPHYEPTTYGAFSQRLLTLNFAHRGAHGAPAG